MVENLPEFMPFFDQLKRLTLDIVSECHDPNPDVMLTTVKELFSRLEAQALQLSLFEDNADAGKALNPIGV